MYLLGNLYVFVLLVNLGWIFSRTVSFAFTLPTVPCKVEEVCFPNFLPGIKENKSHLEDHPS